MFTIAPAAAIDIPELSSVMGAAFLHDTVTSGLLGSEIGRATRAARLFRVMMRSGALRAGRVDMIRDSADGTIMGGAIWESPATSRLHLLHQAPQLPGFLRALGKKGLFAAIWQQSLLRSYHPFEPHWYLAQIGVSERARGEGLGSALLEYRLQAVDALGMPVYLESSNARNRALYERYGFTAIAAIQGLPTASPTAMWRPARPARPGSWNPQLP